MTLRIGLAFVAHGMNGRVKKQIWFRMVSRYLLFIHLHEDLYNKCRFNILQCGVQNVNLY